VGPCILAGKQVNLPQYYIAVKWTIVLYESRTLVLGQEVGPWIPEVAQKSELLVPMRPIHTPTVKDKPRLGASRKRDQRFWQHATEPDKEKRNP
jgi:hypothetical protein